MQSYKQALDICYQLQTVADQVDEGETGVWEEFNILSDMVQSGIRSLCPDTAFIWAAAVKKAAKGF